MKKSIMTIIVLLIVLLCTIPAAAEGVPSFVVDSVSVQPGESVDVTISVKNNPGIASIKLNVAYDSNLTLDKITYNNAINGMFMQPQKLTSPVVLNWFNGVANSEGDWVFATLSFTVSSAAAVGTYPISVTYDENDVYNIDENNLAFGIENGAVTITCAHGSKTEVPSKSPDCVNSGNYQYYICDACNQVFKADGVTETTVEAETLPALDHDWTEKIQDDAHLKSAAANCTEFDTYWFGCSRCSAISNTEHFISGTAGAHSFTGKLEDNAYLVPGSGADCQSVKQYYYACIHCGAKGNEIWDSTVAGSHKPATVWTTENGKHFHKCTVEGCAYIADEAPCSGGTASCTEKAVCSVCNTPYGELIPHSYKNEWSQGDANGHWHDCANCPAHDTPVAHTPNIPAATEEQAKICTSCGYVMEAQLTHTHKTVIVEGFAASCTAAGQKTYYSCACGKWFEDSTANVEITDRDSIIIPALGHDMSEATCTAPAACKRCDYTEGSAQGHAWTEKLEDTVHLRSSASNCTEFDTYWYSCSRCGSISDTEYFTSGKTGAHSFTEELEDNPYLVPGSGADCQSVKQYYYACAYCGTKGTEIWDSMVTGSHKMAPTWTTENGKHFHKCTVEGCSYLTDEALCSGGTASCTEKAVCSVCNTPYGELTAHSYKTEWNPGDTTGHWHDCENCSAHDAPVAHIPGAEATETTPQTCTVCGYIIQPAFGHIHSIVKVEGLAATCTTDGYESYYICESCGKWFADFTANVEIADKDNVGIPALGHDWKDATCTEPKTCQRYGCNATEGDALGHDWKDASCTEPKTCRRLGCNATEGIAKGHTDADHNGKCDVCGLDLTSAPKTGDSSFLTLWIVLLMSSGAGIAALGCLRKKSKFFIR